MAYKSYCSCTIVKQVGSLFAVITILLRKLKAWVSDSQDFEHEMSSEMAVLSSGALVALL